MPGDKVGGLISHEPNAAQVIVAEVTRNTRARDGVRAVRIGGCGLFSRAVVISERGGLRERIGFAGDVRIGVAVRAIAVGMAYFLTVQRLMPATYSPPFSCKTASSARLDRVRDRSGANAEGTVLARALLAFHSR